MDPQFKSRMAWLIAGVVMGLAVAFVWPHEEGLAATSDRTDKFSMVTVPIGLGTSEGVFILDFLTAELRGAIINNNSGRFTNFYVRNVAEDFQLKGNVQYKFAMASGTSTLPSRGPVSMASGIIYIAELNSGRCIAYGFPFNQVNAAVPPVPMIPLDEFPFKQPTE